MPCHHRGMTHSRRPGGAVSTLSLLVIIAGAVLVVAGVSTYALVSSMLGAQHITVAEDAGNFAGQHVTQPWEAYAQATVIAEHASDLAGGRTYAELPREDPVRETVMNASFLQASLFTSVVAFGVAALAAGLGLVFVLIGVALRRMSGAVRVPDGTAAG
jgi:hypothetical protein